MRAYLSHCDHGTIHDQQYKTRPCRDSAADDGLELRVRPIIRYPLKIGGQGSCGFEGRLRRGLGGAGLLRGIGVGARVGYIQEEETVRDRRHRKATEALNVIFYRLLVLEPYRQAFGSKHIGSITGEDVPPHRYLFHCYVYQYHVMEFSICLVKTVSTIRLSMPGARVDCCRL